MCCVTVLGPVRAGFPFHSRERIPMPDSPQYPYQDPTLPPEQRADDLLSRMGLEEKAGLLFQPLAGIGDFDAPGPLQDVEAGDPTLKQGPCRRVPQGR